MCSLARSHGVASNNIIGNASDNDIFNHQCDSRINNLSSTPKNVKNTENLKTVSDLDLTNNTSGSQYQFVKQNDGVIMPIIDLDNNVEITPIKGKLDFLNDSDGTNSDSDDSVFDPRAHEQDSDDSLINSKISKQKYIKSKRNLSYSKPKNVKSKKKKLSTIDAGSCNVSQSEASNLPNPPSLCTFDALSSSGSHSEASNVPQPHSVIDDGPNVSEEIITPNEQNNAKKKERPKSDKKN